MNETEIDARRIENERKKIFKDDLKNTSLKFICVLYFIIGVTASFAIISRELDHTDKGFSYFVFFMSMVIIGQILSIIWIICNRYSPNNFSGRIVSIKKHILLYFVIIPLMVIVLIYLVIQIIQEFQKSNALMAAFAISQIIFLLSVIILMIDHGSDQETNSRVQTDFVHKTSLLITVIGVFISFLFYITRQELNVYFRVHQNFATSINGTIEKVENFLFPVHIAFLIITFGYLLGFLQQFINTKTATFNRSSEESSEVPFRISFFSIIIGVIMIVLPLVSVSVIHIRKWQECVIYHTFTCIVYCLGMILSVIQILEIKRWGEKRINETFTVDKFLMGIGCFGQIVFAIVNISRVCQFFKNAPNIYAMLAVSSVFLLIQIALQNIVMHLTFTWKIKKPVSRSIADICCPSVGLLCLNLGCFFLSFDQPCVANEEISEAMAVNLFHKGLSIISMCFALIHRLHGIVFFVLLLVKLHN